MFGKRFFLGLLLAATVASSGCFAMNGLGIKTRQGRTSAITAGALLSVAAIATVAIMSRGEDSDGDGVDEFPDGEIGCLIGTCALIGGSMAAVGGTLLMGGITAQVEDETVPPTAITVAVAPRAPAPPSTVEPALPEVAVDAVTLRYAQQARSAALAANCGAVRVLLQEIATRDADYHDALLASPAIAGCR